MKIVGVINQRNHFFPIRSEYYTIPPLNELNQMVDSNGDVFVDDFIVGRTGYGCVKFHGKTNVAGLNLDEIGTNLSYSSWHRRVFLLLLRYDHFLHSLFK